MNITVKQLFSNRPPEDDASGYQPFYMYLFEYFGVKAYITHSHNITYGQSKITKKHKLNIFTFHITDYTLIKYTVTINSLPDLKIHAILRNLKSKLPESTK